MNIPKIAFILNTQKRKNQNLIPEIERVFSAYPIQVAATAYAGHATSLASEAVQSGTEVVVSVGGDGTLNEVLNGLVRGCEAVGKPPNKVGLGILPTGSGNDFVKTLAGSRTLESLKESIRQSKSYSIDIGVAAFTSVLQVPEKRYFINIADVGIGGVIAAKLSRYKSWFGPAFTYQRAIISALWGYSPEMLAVETSEETMVSPMMSLVVANGKFFGNGLGIAPNARLDDGLMEVVMLKNISLTDYIRQLPKLKRCEVLVHPEVSYASSASVTVATSNGRPLPIDMDGEYVGVTPVTFSVLNRLVTVF
ncbi:MAG: diacylglycerol kinase family lipid kinase [Bacteroidetes Order II. Incertae sedis bacterium]|nr:diacylglycerol kinase family lipid kinase [Bacteroidetes Order II. bacterium]